MSSTSNNTNTPKVWLITGCSSGFGHEFALEARQRGDHVIATARNINALSELKQVGCDVLELDVTSDSEVVKKAVSAAHALYGRIDILVNNAGVAMFGTVEGTTLDEHRHMFNVNLFGLISVTQAVLPYMREQRSGFIANIGSVACRYTFAYSSAYSAAKGAVAIYSTKLKKEVAHFGIDVINFEPGMFRTRMSQNFYYSQNLGDEYRVVTEPVVEHMLELVKNGADARKGIKLMIDAITKSGKAKDRPVPSRLLIGGHIPLVQATIEEDVREINEWKDFSNSIFEE